MANARELKRIAGNMSAELPPEASALIRSEVTRGYDTLTDLSEQVAQVKADGEARKALERIREWPGLDQGPTS
jgi:hypothetical protein